MKIERGDFEFAQSKKYVDHTDDSVTNNLPEFGHWLEHVPVKAAFDGKVVSGFKRGSKELGVPTANIEMTDENIERSKDLVPGVYVARVKFVEPTLPFLEADKSYMGALSIGWNPQYSNAQKTIEVFIIDNFAEDFNGERMQIDIEAFLRAEARFGSFDSLILAI